MTSDELVEAAHELWNRELDKRMADAQFEMAEEHLRQIATKGKAGGQ